MDRGGISMAEVCVFLAEGFEEIEGLTVVDLLRRAGIDTVTVSVGDTVRVTGSHGISVEADCLLKQAKAGEADLLVLPGGMPGTKNLAACEALTELLKKSDGRGQRVAAICAAPSVLGELGLLEGKKAVCYPGFEEKLRKAAVGKEAVVTDGRITTSRGMGTAIAFGLELISLLRGKETSEKVRESILYTLETPQKC